MDFSPAMATRKDSTDAQMLFVGSTCSQESCSLVDFLPIRCDLCAATFCSDHFRPLDHKCAKYDHSKADRIAPSCPLCSAPVSIPVGQDPNLKMDAHIMNECPVMGNNRPAKSQAPRCGSNKCNKVLIAPIRCNSCRKDFCPEHRFSQQHNCASQSSVSIPKRTPSPTSQPTSSRLADKFANISIAGARPSQSAASAKAAAAAISRAATAPRPRPVATTSQPKPVPAQASGSGSSSSSKPAVHNPFNKTDRRAKAERVSQLRALQDRNRKGLLSNAEKARLAELEAQAKDNGDCVLM